MRFKKNLLTFLAVFALAISLLPATSFAGGRGGSFGGGGRSFGGGGFGGGARSFGGGSRSFSGGGFSSRPSGGSFGGSSRSTFGGSSSSGIARTTSPGFSGSRSSSSSFSRSGGFGSSGRVNSTSINASRSTTSYYRGIAPSYHTSVYYGGMSYPAYGYGFMSGYSLGMLSSPWTHWMPFHPAFYYNPPVYYNGGYYPGDFSFTRFILGIAVICFVIWLIAKMFRGFGGGKGVRYTNYQ